MNDPQAYQTDAARWDAVAERDPAAADAFVYAVSKTGIYCRPGCPSRLPNRDNVSFFDAWQAAEAAGFRPCKRCRPRMPAASDAALQAVIEACRAIEQAERAPTLRELADAAGYSPTHFQRLFKERVGVSPKQYAMEMRARRVREGLRAGETVTDAVYGAGFGSAGTFYASPALGMKPAQYKTGGADMAIHYALAQGYLGWVLIAATDQGLCRIDLGDDPEALVARLRADFPRADLGEDGAGLADAEREVLALLEAPERGLSLPLDIQGTAFQRRVWAALQQIPAGSTVSYAELAARVGNPRGARAVAQACASNRLAVAVPCHRVVRGDGELGGYRWGLERKRALLEREEA